MKYGVFVEITGGKSHFDLSEDRCENLEDCRPLWNVSFQLDGQDESYCIASSLVTRVMPEDKIFTPAMVKTLQNTKRHRGRRKWWGNLMNTLSQVETKEFTPDCTIWRLGGRAHFWPIKWWRGDDVIVFAEYDAIEQHGYAVIVSDFEDASLLQRAFPNSLQGPRGFRITKEEEELLIEKW